MRVAQSLLLARNPKTRLIWAHTGFSTPLAKLEELFGKYPQLPRESAEKIAWKNGARLFGIE